MLWIFDRHIESGLISGKEAIEKIRHLLSTNIIYRDNSEMNDEIEKRIEKWKCL
jgi:hypothetical protein